jgi:UDP-galactopyranose mutase
MDELSLFHGAPPSLAEDEKRLLARANVMFTGGHSLYAHKRDLHHNIHAFPSSVDVPHFAGARELQDDPPDQAEIPHPRVGYFGVIDERMDMALIEELADARPELQLVMIGPVAKIDPATLPRRSNIHWLGGKPYSELPAYLAGWDVAMMPFARNDSTRFISPTKTPEYLAAGKPVVSTSIRDVVEPYGRHGLAWIADTAVDFAVAIDEALASDRMARLAHADEYLAELSWDRTWSQMWRHVERVLGPASRSHGTSAGGARAVLAQPEE